MKRDNVVVCIPALNEEATLPRVLVDTFKYAKEVIVCANGCTDSTLGIAERMGAHVVNHPVNLGYGRSLIDLFREAEKYSPKAVVTLDADGQHDPNEIPRVVAPILNGDADVVVGSRFMGAKGEIRKYREVGINALNFLLKKASGKSVNDSQCGFRAYSSEALKKLRLTESGMGVSAEILLKANELGLRVVEVPVHVYYDGLRASSQNPVAQLADVVGAVIRRVVERQPLRYFGFFALASLLVCTFFTVRTVDLYVSTGMLITNYALISLFSFMFFGIMMNMAVVLYAVSRIRQEIEARR